MGNSGSDQPTISSHKNVLDECRRRSVPMGPPPPSSSHIYEESIDSRKYAIFEKFYDIPPLNFYEFRQILERDHITVTKHNYFFCKPY